MRDADAVETVHVDEWVNVDEEVHAVDLVRVDVEVRMDEELHVDEEVDFTVVRWKVGQTSRGRCSLYRNGQISVRWQCYAHTVPARIHTMDSVRRTSTPIDCWPTFERGDCVERSQLEGPLRIVGGAIPG